MTIAITIPDIPVFPALLGLAALANLALAWRTWRGNPLANGITCVCRCNPLQSVL